MKRRRFSVLFLAAVFAILLIAGCQESLLEPGLAEVTTDQEALLKIVDEDSSIASFEANYNEEDAMDFLGKTSTKIHPFRVGHKVRLVNRNLDVNFVGDTAYATLTKTYEGILYIAASFYADSSKPDSIIKKPFTSQVTRNLIFIKIDSTRNRFHNWKLVAISLPEGGTLNRNINIMKLTVSLPNGETLEIESPNDYYLSRGWGWWRNLPIVPRNDSVKIQVELFSAYEEDDFVTLTYGADFKGLHRAKRMFELVSSRPFNNGFVKVYEQNFRTNFYPGHFHAVVNAYPKQVIFDDAAPVENNMWGIPYLVRK